MSFKKIPFEVYPLLGAVGVGVSLGVYCTQWNLRNNPDINVRKNGYSWEQIDPKTHKPHLPFMAGEESNQKIQQYKERHPEVAVRLH